MPGYGFSKPPGLKNMELLFLTEHGIRVWQDKRTGSLLSFGIDTVGSEGRRYLNDVLTAIQTRTPDPDINDYAEPRLSSDDIRDLMMQDFDELLEADK